MNEVRPYAAGSTVKWREGSTEYAGIIASVTLASNVSEDDFREGPSGAGSLEPVYRIILSDHSVATRSHGQLVLV